MVSVVSSLAFAFVRGRNVQIPWTELQLSVRDKIMLAGLFVLYLATIATSLFISHRV
jgi:hypothetical protein